MALKKIVGIVGPTGVGKTQAAFLLAQKINGEIISCDSMQVYQGMAIATNKPPAQILKKIPHHLLGVVSLSEEFNAAVFRKQAASLIKKIHKRNKIPIVTGGTGLYLKALLDGLFSGPPGDEILRKKFREKVQQYGLASLYDQLKKIDATAAAKIHPHDQKRIIRALEVYYLTKKPISILQKNRQGIWGTYDIALFALNKERNELYQRIEERVEEMFQQGLVDEIQKHISKKISKTAHGIIGLKELKGYFDDQYDLETAKDLMKQNTRRLAKRQLTWFRAEKRLVWIQISADQSIGDAVKKMTKEITSKKGVHA